MVDRKLGVLTVNGDFCDEMEVRKVRRLNADSNQNCEKFGDLLSGLWGFFKNSMSPAANVLARETDTYKENNRQLEDGDFSISGNFLRRQKIWRAYERGMGKCN